MVRITESSTVRIVDYIPVISTFSGIARLTKGLVSKCLHPIENEIPKVLQDRVHIWSDEKRGAIALIPIIGNAIIYHHDRKVSKELMDTLKTSEKKDLSFLLFQVPRSLQTRDFFLEIIKENPLILYYTPNHLIKNMHFIADAIRLNKNAASYCKDFTKEEILNLLKAIPVLFRNNFNDEAILNNVPKFTSDANFLLAAANLTCDVTPYLHKHKDNKDLILQIMKLFRNKKVMVGSPQAENYQPDLSITINALKAASDNLKKDPDFREKALAIYDKSADFF